MLCVVMFSVFLPALRRSSALCASTDAAHTTTSSGSRRSLFMARILRRALAILVDGDDEDEDGRPQKNEKWLRDFSGAGAFHQNCARDRHEVAHGVNQCHTLHPRRHAVDGGEEATHEK